MKLRTAHIILMVAAIALGVLLSLYGVRQYANESDPAGLGLAAGGAALTVSVVFYLRYFLRKR